MHLSFFESSSPNPHRIGIAGSRHMVGCGFFLLNPRAVFTQATSSHAEARSPQFVRGLAAGFAALRAHPLATLLLKAPRVTRRRKVRISPKKLRVLRALRVR